MLRRDEWAFIPSYDGPAINQATHTELGNSSEPQLYNLSLDIGQISNVAAEHEAMTNEMSARLKEIIKQKMTRPLAPVI